VLKYLDLLLNAVLLRAANAPHGCVLMNAPQGERE
jgi:hypothetical protein